MCDERDEFEEFKDEKDRVDKLLKSREQKKKHSVGRALALVSQLGIQMAVCIVLGVVIGILLDRWLDTTPIFIIIFTIFGTGAAIKMIYDIAKEWDD